MFAAFRPLLADFLSTIVFVAFYAITGSVHDAILLGIAAGIVQIAYMLLAGKPIAAMQWMSLALVIVLGGASLLTADPRFIMIKPSIGFFAVGCIMLRRGWMGRYLPRRVRDNVHESVTVFWGYVWSAQMFVLAAGNLALALLTGPRVWAWFNAVVPLAAQAGALRGPVSGPAPPRAPRPSGGCGRIKALPRPFSGHSAAIFGAEPFDAVRASVGCRRPARRSSCEGGWT